jgi:DNA-binding SARP family transcriptional activator
MCEQDTERALALLSQARDVWEQIGDPLGKLRSDLAKARRLGSDAGLELAGKTGQRAGRLGAHALSASARALVAELEHEAGPPVSIGTLGAFTLWRRGAAVPASEWSSDDARHLLQLLLAERGGPVALERITATLWAGAGDAEGRLAAAIAALREMLDPDHPDRYVSQSGGLVSLGPARIDVDVERFVELADEALGVDPAQPTALTALERAEEVYEGDFLEGHDEPWVMPVRDHAREHYVLVAGRLADHWLRSGDTAAAARYLFRVLERRPHDERAHLELISLQLAGGRHAEAHRHYRSYCGRMEEIDAEPAPFPALPH